jgi:dTDP-4-amino-4,6-dideoxygalactose transaminase
MPNNITVPFVDLARQFANIETELTKEFLSVGRSGVYVMGGRLESFEKKMAEYLDVKHVLGVADGSDALFLIMHALGIGAGDEVITAPNSFIASAWTIVAVGAKPVFVDVDDDLNISPQLLEAAITPSTKAIMPVHLAGRPAQMDEINKIAAKYNLYVIEDSAQAIGASYNGKKTGTLGIAAGFSLHPLKNLGIYGDGGLITTNDDDLNIKLRKLRNHGLINRDECEIWGYNSRLDPMQAAFGEVKLKYLDQWNNRCRDIATMYREGLSNEKELFLPVDKEGEICVYHNFVIRTERRDELMQYMKENGVDTRVHYPIPIHLQVAAESLNYKNGDFPKTERFAKTMVSLPIYPELTDAEVNHVIQAVTDFFK